MDSIFKLEGKVMHYAWGGYDFIPHTLGIQNTERKPFAEYWLGVHPLAMTVVKKNNEQNLDAFIQADPQRVLSTAVFNKFQSLPFLLKIQDVREVLSIQVHPNKQQAEAGFEAEERMGIPVDAPNRNYKDKNHKPEMAVAVSEFWLLHGFRSTTEIEKILATYPSFKLLSEKLNDGGIEALYRYVMTIPQQKVDEILLPVVNSEIQNAQRGYCSKNDAAFWIARYFNNEPQESNLDRGIFSMFFLNIVRMAPGQSIFQGAGILHAYLEGYNVELMANSDNVLRGGLTPKHIDVEELLKLTSFEPVTPVVSDGRKNGLETIYKVPADDFAISKIQLASGQTFTSGSGSFEIHIVLQGSVSVQAGGSEIIVNKGESYAVIADTDFVLTCSTDADIYRAFVPLND